jgi:hypothetical protein
VLKQINDKHNTVTHGNYTVAEVERDMSRVVNILKSVVAMENDKKSGTGFTPRSINISLKMFISLASSNI